jgi:archaellum component FlaF (FlaF/FlaG flagellin family)
MVRLFAVGVVLLVAVAGVGTVVSGAPAGPANGPGAADAATTADSSIDRSSTTQRGDGDRSDRRQFNFRIQEVSKCGLTCRDVTVTAVNNGDTTAENVTVQTRLKADGEVVWRGSENVQKLEPGESTTVTKRVRLGMFELWQVEQNDGFVTAKTTVSWDDGRERFSNRQRVI